MKFRPQTTVLVSFQIGFIFMDEHGFTRQWIHLDEYIIKNKTKKILTDNL